MSTRKRQIKMTVNGTPCELDVAVNRTLLDILRNELNLTGTKSACNEGACGACTVHVNGRTVNACLILAPDADGKTITTIEGIGKHGALHPLQQAFIDEGAVQCGYCTPGMIMQALDLLARNSNPSEYDIREAMVGNLCRCTGYEKIVRAIVKAARDMRQTRIKMIREAVKRKEERSKKGKTKKKKQ